MQRKKKNKSAFNNLTMEQEFKKKRLETIPHYYKIKQKKIIQFILQSEQETYNVVKYYDMPSSFSSQPFGHHAFNKIEANLLFKAKKSLSTNKLHDVELMLTQKTSKLGLYRTIYYIIRVGDAVLLDVLLKEKKLRSGELIDILSTCYEELRVKKVSLSIEMKQYVENILLNRRLNSYKWSNNKSIGIQNLHDRVKLICDEMKTFEISLFESHKNKDLLQYQELTKRGILITSATFIVENLRILQAQLNSSSNQLPWKAIEFYIVIFIWSLANSNNFDPIFLFILDEEKLLSYIFHFREFLKKINIENVTRSNTLINHNLVTIKNYVNNSPFMGLIEDYNILKNIYFFKRILKYIKIAANIEKKSIVEFELTIKRALHVFSAFIIHTETSVNFAEEVQKQLMIVLPTELIMILMDFKFSSTLVIQEYDKVQEYLKEAVKLVEKLFIDETQKIIRRFIEDNVEKEAKKINKLFKDDRLFSVFYNNNNIIEKSSKLKFMENVLELEQTLRNNKLTKNEVDTFKQLKALNLNHTRNTTQMVNNSLLKLFNVRHKPIIFLQQLNCLSIVFKKIDKVSKTYGNSLNFLISKLYTYFRLRIIKNELPGLSNRIDLIFRKILSCFIFDLNIKIFEPSEFCSKFCLPSCNSVETELEIFFHELNLNLPKSEYNLVFNKFKNMKKNYYLKSRINNLVNKLEIDESDHNEINKLCKEFTVNETILKGSIENKKKYLSLLKIDNTDYEVFLDHSKINNLDSKKKAYEDFFKSLLLDTQLSNKIYNEINLMINKNKDKLQIIFEEKKILYNLLMEEFNLKNKNRAVFMCFETLCLDINNILNILSMFQDDIFALDDYTPSLYGKNLLNYLADGDVLYDLLFPNIELAIIFSLQNYFMKNSLSNINRVGSKVEGSVIDILKRFEKKIKWTENQSKIFIAASTDCLSSFKWELEKGADIRGISIDRKRIDNYFIDFIIPDIYLEERNCPILHAEVLKEKKKKVISVIEKTDCIQTVDKFNSTALHYAAEIGNTEIVQILISKGADINARNNNNMTPLHVGIVNGYLEVVKELIKHKSDPYDNFLMDTLIKRDIFIESELTNGFVLALKCGHWNIVEFIKDEYKIKFFFDSIDMTFLSESNSFSRILKYFIEIGLDPTKSKKKYTFLQKAAYFGSRDIVKLLIKNNAVVSNDTSLHSSAINGNLELFKLILTKDKTLIDKKNNSDETVLHEACYYGKYEIVNELLLQNINFENKNQNLSTPLHLAVESCNLSIVELILNKFPTILNELNKQKATALHLACSSKNKYSNAIVESLIARNCDINVVDQNMETPLHYACKAGNLKTVQMLIKKKANLEIKNNFNETPLFHAIRGKHINILEILLANKVDVNLKSTDVLAFTPLHLTIDRGHILLTNMILDTKMADINATCVNNCRPLHLAVHNNSVEFVKLLVHAGASLNVNDSDNVTPLSYAVKNKLYSVVKILLQFGAKTNKILENDFTLLHWTLFTEDMHMVKILINHGMDVNATAVLGITPLHIAANLENSAAVNLLLKSGAHVNSQQLCEFPLKNKELLFIQTKLKSLTTMNDFLTCEAYALLMYHLQTPVHIAITLKNYNILKMLVSNGASVNRVCGLNRTPLSIASTHKDIDILMYLIKNGAIIRHVSLHPICLKYLNV